MQASAGKERAPVSHVPSHTWTGHAGEAPAQGLDPAGGGIQHGCSRTAAGGLELQALPRDGVCPGRRPLLPHQGSGEPQPPPPGWGPHGAPGGQADSSGSSSRGRAGLTYRVGGKAKLLRAKAFHKGGLTSLLSCLITILQASPGT